MCGPSQLGRLQTLAELPEQKEPSKNDRPEQHDWQPPTLE
jgi:hypothetical protein